MRTRADLVWLGVELRVLHDVRGGGAEADAVRVAKRREAAASPLLQETAVLHRVHLADAQAELWLLVSTFCCQDMTDGTEL